MKVLQFYFAYFLFSVKFHNQNWQIDNDISTQDVEEHKFARGQKLKKEKKEDTYENFLLQKNALNRSSFLQNNACEMDEFSAH